MAPDGSTLAGVGLVTDAQEPLRRLTVADYHRMIEVGILTEDDRVELLEGAIIEMSPEGPPHAAVNARLARFLIRAIDDPLLVRVGNPLTLEPYSEPEPDFSIVDAADSNFHQHPSSAHLAVEVSKTSLRKDLARKARIYAGAGVHEYWVVDLKDSCVHVHLHPGEDGYATRRILRPPERLQAEAVALPPLDLRELLAEG